MMYARDYRRIGRESLSGMWPTAILASFVSGLLGCTMYGSSWINLNSVVQGNASVSDMSDPYAVIETGDGTIQNFVESDFFMPMMAFLGTLLTVLLIYVLVCIIIGGAVTLGYARFNLNLVDGSRPGAGDVFSNIGRLGAGFCMWFWRGLYITLWSLLLVIPGIVATYSYAMVPYIMAEHPELRAREALRESKNMMKGKRWRLFCLELSFIGWTLLAALVFAAIFTAGFLTGSMGLSMFGLVVYIVELLFLYPYVEASRAAFYRELTEQRYSNPQPEAQWREVPQDEMKEETYDYNNDPFH